MGLMRTPTRCLVTVMIAALFWGWGTHLAVAQNVPVTPTVAVVNSNAADFTIVAATSGAAIHVRALQAQNIGTGAKVTLMLCDGTCGTAANVKFKWDLAAATATTAPGLVTLPACSGMPCDWALTVGNGLIAQVDTGATNNVRVMVTYYLDNK